MTDQDKNDLIRFAITDLVQNRKASLDEWSELTEYFNDLLDAAQAFENIGNRLEF